MLPRLYIGGKVCSRCRQKLPCDEIHFGRDKSRRGGFNDKCRDCAAEYAREQWAKKRKGPDTRRRLNGSPPKGFESDWTNGPWGMDKVGVIARIMQVPATLIYWAGEREDDMLKVVAGYRAIPIEALKAEIRKFNRGTLDGDDQAPAPSPDSSPPADPEAVPGDSV